MYFLNVIFNLRTYETNCLIFIIFQNSQSFKHKLFQKCYCTKNKNYLRSTKTRTLQ